MNVADIFYSLFPFLANEHNRTGWIIDELKKIPKGKTILDAGAGECQYKKYCSKLRYTSQDFNQYNGKGNNKGLQTSKWDVSQIDIVSDIVSIPVKDRSFDNILCSEVLEHLPLPDLAIKEFSRILKKNGKLILTAPFCSQTHFAPFHYSTGFNIYWYEKIFKKYNLKIKKYKNNGNYFDYVCQEILRIPFVLKKYSLASYLSFILYPILLPIVVAISILSKITKGSGELLNFGYNVIAIKI